MNIAFYAPMKPPTSDRPSGDRTIARGLMAALEAADCDVILASDFRSYRREPPGPDERRPLEAAAADEIARVVEALRARNISAWLTYHLFYKAPDLIGPAVCRQLDLPYIVAEASLAPKRAAGAWSAQHRQAVNAVAAADHVIFLNTVDKACVLPHMAPGASHSQLNPFLQVSDPGTASPAPHQRIEWSERLDVSPETPWIVAVGMMRPGDKLASYRYLADVAELLPAACAALIVVGDGEAEDDVRTALAKSPVPVRFAGRLAKNELEALLSAADIFAWPAIGEAVGMATLEAMAAGLAVVSGREGAVADVIVNGQSGIIADTPAEMAASIDRLIQEPATRTRLGQAARHQVLADHTVKAAGARLKSVLNQVVGARA